MEEIKKITSKENPFFKRVKAMSLKNSSDEEYFLVEGHRMISEAFNKGYRCSHVFFSEEMPVPTAEYTCEQYIILTQALFKEISKTVNSQGIMALVKKSYYTLSDIINQKESLIVIASGIQDPGNLGTIIRTSAAAGATGVILTKGTVDLYNPKVVRATMGSIFQIPIIQGVEDVQVMNALNEKTIKVVVADVQAEQEYFNIDMRKPLALVIGNENKGPAKCWKESEFIKAKISLACDTESLNAAVAAGVLIYEAVRQNCSKL